MKREKITYIFNSGFIYEDHKNIFIFDFFIPPINHQNMIEDYLSKASLDKKITIFVSHGHHDHYNKEIFRWRDLGRELHYIISNEVADAYSYKDDKTIFLGKNESLKVNSDVTVHTFDSTDTGLSFLVDTGEKMIFHSGDLNWWDWGNEDSEEETIFMEKKFKEIVKEIKSYTKSKKIDLAFFPVDPRLEDRAYKGVFYFIEELSPERLIPMHFGDVVESSHYLKELCKGWKIAIGDIGSDGKIRF